MSFFTQAEEDSLAIRRMILHVVGAKTFEAMRERKPEHTDFFQTKILEHAADSVFSFKTNSTTRLALESIAQGSTTFQRGAQSLSRAFNTLHRGGSADGVLCIFELDVGVADTVVYSFIKYDYKVALVQNGAKPGDALRRIVTALIEDKKAVQKTALIRVVNGVAETSVSARDRKKQAPDLADYFEEFLGVTRTISEQELSHMASKLLRRTLQTCKDLLPDKDVAKAFRHAKGILGKRLKVDEDAIIEAVLSSAGDPTDDKTVQRLERETRKRVRESKLHHLEFKPDRSVLRQPAIRKLRTIEGVTVTFPDIQTNPNVVINNIDGGGKRIVIETKEITENGLVAERLGKPT
ncbi:nucleoid-associated protein [Stutzerimonas sp. VN223-3]|uniref:nucleoid-associated protein n=1 Tax=Stutzerimonas sp. VN223-3 TaxID=3384601 RepID=UPI0038B485BF